MTKYPLLQCLQEGIPRRLYLVWEVPRCDLVRPGLAQKHRRLATVQLVVVVAQRKDYVQRQNDQRPRPAQT